MLLHVVAVRLGAETIGFHDFFFVPGSLRAEETRTSAKQELRHNSSFWVGPATSAVCSGNSVAWCQIEKFWNGAHTLEKLDSMPRALHPKTFRLAKRPYK